MRWVETERGGSGSGYPQDRRTNPLPFPGFLAWYGLTVGPSTGTRVHCWRIGIMGEDFLVVEVWLQWPADTIKACGIWAIPRGLNQAQTEKLVDSILSAMESWFLKNEDKFPGHARHGHKYVPVTLGTLLSVAATRECSRFPEDDPRRFIDRNLIEEFRKGNRYGRKR